MSLEVQIGADKSDFDKKIKEIEFDIKELSKEKSIQIKAGLDTTEITKNIKDAKKSLTDLKQTLKDTGNAFQGAAPKIANGGNALMQFSRIAQDAPFGIMGIGNNITATVESFNHLKQSTGSAGGALKAMASSIMGSGGILLGVSLLTSGLTYMSQKGLTVGDVFNKLTGRFDEFKKALSEVNAEAAKTAGSEASMMKGYVSAAQNVDLSMRDRLLAVKKLQDEYPAYFGNLTKEQILNGNVAGAVKAATAALIAKAKAHAFANKVAEISEKQVPLREKETALIAENNRLLNRRNELEALYGDMTKRSSVEQRQSLYAARGNYKRINEELRGVQDELRKTFSESAKWQEEVNKNVAIEIPTEYKIPSVKKLKKIKDVGLDEIEVRVKPVLDLAMPKAFSIEDALNQQYSAKKFDPFASLTERMAASRAKMIEVGTSGYTAMSDGLRQFIAGMNNLMQTSLADTFGGIGDAIGTALANGANVLQAVGNSILGSMGKFLSDMGGLLIQYGTLAVVKGKLDLAILTGGPVAIAAGAAAIGVGIALKAAGGAIGGMAQKGGGGKNGVSAGNSVSSPTSTVNNGSSGGWAQNVVFEISGQSLVGVLSNTLNRNIKLGGTPAI